MPLLWLVCEAQTYSLQTRYARQVGGFYTKRRVRFFEKIEIRILESKDGSSITLEKTENPKMDFEYIAIPRKDSSE